MNHKGVTGYNITLDQALKQGGFYGPTGIWNSLVKIDGLVLRARVETLVIKKDLQQIYMHITNFAKKKYRIPGGSCEKDIPNYIQAANECNEEARIAVKNAINTGIHYIKKYKNPDKWDGIRKELMWTGTYTEVYVGEYDGPFTGKVDDEDKDDDMYNNGRFYNISEVYDILTEKHKQVIDDIFPVIKRSEIKEGTDMIYGDDNNKTVHYYPYYTPREMYKLGVHNESKNKYSDIQDDAIEWYHEYTDTLYNPDSENWLKELQERYDEYMLNPTRETQQLVLNLGWNLFVVPTLENVLIASKRTEEKLKLEQKEIEEIVIKEEMIFSKKDIVVNIDDFDSGKSNILFITGLSGSGKTTMSSELCEQYAATKLSLDYFQNYHSIQNDPRFAKIKTSRKNDPMLIWIDKYMKLNPEIKKQSHMFSNIDLVSFKDYFIPFFRWLISELKKDDDRYIIEGLHILLYIPYKDIKKYPLICINTSATKSLVRHWQRDDWTIKDIVQNGYDDILQFKRWNDMYTDFKKSIDESVIVEAVHPYEFGKSQNLYFISELSMNDELLVPRIPDNYMTRNSFEDNVTPRVCFSATIDGALMALSQNIKGKKFYVHVPEDGQRLTIIKPAVASVPDQLITHEHWVMEKVNLRCIGQIEITGDGDNEYEYTYKEYKYNKTDTAEIPGAKEHKEKLYDWKWRWIWKDDTNLTQENASLLEGFLKSDFSYSGIKTSAEKLEFKRDFREVFKEDPTESSINYMQIIKYKGSLVGYIGFSRYKEGKKKYLGIGNFMILKKYQRNGMGSKVISDIIDRYKDNYDELYCYVDKDNKKAIKFYKNIGHVNTSNLTKYGYYVSLYNGTISESSLLEMKRSELDDSEFGLPELRKYPMPDKDHVLSAIKFFNYVSPENEKELARNIKKKMKQYGVSPDHVGNKNRLKKYLTEDMDIVMDLSESLQFTNFEHTKPALVFDLGSVLVDNKISFKETLYNSKLIPDDIVEELDSYIGETYQNSKNKLEYCSETDYYKYMVDHAPEHLKSYIPAALNLEESNLKLLDYSKTLIKKLKEKGYKLYYISNWSKWSKDKLVKTGFFDFLKEFDGGIFSGDVGHMKPDNSIFQYFFNKYKDITPTECMFFDDRHENISAAMNVGMYGILFNKLYTVEWIYDNLINGNEE